MIPEELQAQSSLTSLHALNGLASQMIPVDLSVHSNQISQYGTD
jgi:hypothetical protein